MRVELTGSLRNRGVARKQCCMQYNMPDSKVLLIALLLLLSVWVSTGLEDSPHISKLQSLWQDGEDTRDVHLELSEVTQQVSHLRSTSY